MNKIRYINCACRVCKKFNMPAKIAFNYLKQYKSLDFLDKCFEAEHLMSLNDSLYDLIVICKRNGGTLG